MPNDTRDVEEQFYTDVMTTAAEGGIGYWSQLSTYRWNAPYDERCMAVHVEDENSPTGDYREFGVWVTPEYLRHVIYKIVAEGHHAAYERRSACLGMHLSYVRDIAAAVSILDAGDIDASLADMIVQVAVLGEVVYG